MNVFDTDIFCNILYTIDKSDLQTYQNWLEFDDLNSWVIFHLKSKIFSFGLRFFYQTGNDIILQKKKNVRYFLFTYRRNTQCGFLQIILQFI